jgi:hypothetical protein
MLFTKLITSMSLLAVAVVALGCGSVTATPETEAPPYKDRVPASESQCTGNEKDASCAGGTARGKEISLSGKPGDVEQSAMHEEMSTHSIQGECQLEATDGKKPQPCGGKIRLLARSTGAAEIRSVKIEGAHFRVDGLNQESYLLESASSDYKVISDAGPLHPGQIDVLIKVRRIKK